MRIGFLSHVDLNLYAFRLPVMKELNRLGHHSIAIAPQGEYLEKIEAEGIDVCPYAIERKSLNPLKEIETIKHIYETIKPLQLDILHTFTAKPNIYGTIAGKMAKIPRIINLVEGLGSFYLENNIKSVLIRTIIEQLYKRTFTMSSAVMFVNSDDPAYFVKKGIIAEQNVYRINGVGIDTNEWKRTAETAEKHPLTVVMVARLLRHKGACEYLAACMNLKKRFPAVSFLYVGGEDKANPSGLDKSIFHAYESIEYLGERHDVKAILQKADIFVLPSYREGLPRTVLEAMSMELAVVGTDIVGTRDCIKNGQTGLLVPAKDEAALEKAIATLIENEPLRKKLAANARRECVKTFAIEPIIQAHLRLYGL